jgi:cysteine desulfuration protein SufE
MSALDHIFDDYELLEPDDRYRLLIDLGRALDRCPTRSRRSNPGTGCSASVWVYPVRQENGRLRFLADSNAAITKGIIALVLAVVQDRTPAEILSTDIPGELERFELGKQLSSNRTQGIPNMIALIRETAERLARD